MSEVTSNEALVYPCLTELQQRHWIQDLASSADLALTRIQSDIDFVTHRPKARMRRTSGTQTVVDNTPTVLTYTVTDYQPSPIAWANVAAGTISPTVAGLYYVEVLCQCNFSGSGDAYVLDIQYGGVTYLSRKWDFSTGFDGLKVSGLIPVDLLSGTSAVPELRARLTVSDADPGSVAVSTARFACQMMTRCGAALNVNPWMERTVSPWTGSLTTVALSTTEKWRGNSSLRAVPSAINYQVISDRFPAAVGVRYQGIAYVRADATSSHHAEIRFYNNAGTLVGTATGSTTTTTANTWVPVFVTSAAAPATTVAAQLIIDHDGAATTPIYVDDAQVYQACVLT